MPQVNISALNGQELRQLLDSSRRRGDAALSYKVLQEMAARREAAVERRGPFAMRRTAEPRHIDVDLSDPLEADDVPPMPNWRPPALNGEGEAEPMDSPAHQDEAPPLDDDRPLTLHDADPESPGREAADANGAGPPFQPVELESTRPPPPRRFRLLAGLALGAVLGIALGWLGGWLARDAMAPPGAPTAAPIQTAALTPPAAPVPPLPAPSIAEAVPETPPDPAVAPPSPDAVAAPPPKAQEAAREPVPDGAALELPAPDAEAAVTSSTAKATARAARSASDRSAPATAPGCANQPTPADRAICGDPRLKRLQGELRQAYNEALDAHEDRALLRQRQLAWADARNAVTDPARLTRLYEQRIRKLNAATAEARRTQR
jgi:uncharacterized protein YecT (DUF1311 family)